MDKLFANFCVTQFLDPRESRFFYYNIRTGESVWEKPIEFIKGDTLKKTKKRKKNDLNDTS
jgi:hypothetical protein